ncbi:MAG: RluA family pseudouridine synthase [Oscillospiraceae bacterium]|nr:RluA family pseudouridine synthase [Oscillospiraceae bacterium]
MSNFIIKADDTVKGKRLDKFVSEAVDSLTRTAVQKLLEENSISINNVIVCDKNYKIKVGDEIEVTIPEPKELDLVPQNIPIDIIYEDDSLLVVNKPKGMVVHPAAGNPDKTLVNALLYHCKGRLSSINGVIRPGIVHRIDKDTSGLLMIAKTDEAHLFLAEQIKDHSFMREYEAIIYGTPPKDEGFINAPIGRHPNDRKRMCVTDKNSKEARTHFTVLKRYKGFSHIRVRLETGRTHQIRVHMAYIGYPIAGDAVYGPRKIIEELNGQCLHAKKLGFIHPQNRGMMEFDSELPLYFKEFLEKLEKDM